MPHLFTKHRVLTWKKDELISIGIKYVYSKPLMCPYIWSPSLIWVIRAYLQYWCVGDIFVTALTVSRIGKSYVGGNGPLTRYVKLQVAHAPGMPGTYSPAADFKGNRYLAITACITARASRTCRDACRDRLPAVTGKTFPAFPAHAQPVILRIW